MDRKVAIQIKYDANCFEMLNIASKSGFKYVALGFSYNNFLYNDNWRESIIKLKEVLDNNDLKCIQTHAPYYDLFISAEVLNEQMETALLRCVITCSWMYRHNISPQHRRCMMFCR